MRIDGTYVQPKPTPERAGSRDAFAAPPLDAAAPASARERRPSAATALGRRSFIEVLGEANRREADRQRALDVRGAGITHEGRTAVTPQPPKTETGALAHLWVDRTLRMEDQVRRLLAEVGGGRTFSAGELIALQAMAFRYAQTIEVLSRAVDRMVGGVKQALGTQV